MATKKRKRFVADFETTKTGEGNTHIWAYGVTEVGNTNFFTWGKTLISSLLFVKKKTRLFIFTI